MRSYPGGFEPHRGALPLYVNDDAAYADRLSETGFEDHANPRHEFATGCDGRNAQTGIRATDFLELRLDDAIAVLLVDAEGLGCDPLPFDEHAEGTGVHRLREFGLHLGDEVEIRVWDSSAEVRYLVLPQRPQGTDGWSEEQLAAIVTRNCMIGTALPAR